MKQKHCVLLYERALQAMGALCDKQRNCGCAGPSSPSPAAFLTATPLPKPSDGLPRSYSNRTANGSITGTRVLHCHDRHGHHNTQRKSALPHRLQRLRLHGYLECVDIVDCNAPAHLRCVPLACPTSTSPSPLRHNPTINTNSNTHRRSFPLGWRMSEYGGVCWTYAHVCHGNLRLGVGQNMSGACESAI